MKTVNNNFNIKTFLLAMICSLAFSNVTLANNEKNKKYCRPAIYLQSKKSTGFQACIRQ